MCVLASIRPIVPTALSLICARLSFTMAIYFIEFVYYLGHSFRGTACAGKIHRRARDYWWTSGRHTNWTITCRYFLCNVLFQTRAANLSLLWMVYRFRIEIREMKTWANTGHAVLISTSTPPKMKRCYGRTDVQADGRTDPLIDVFDST